VASTDGATVKHSLAAEIQSWSVAAQIKNEKDHCATVEIKMGKYQNEIWGSAKHQESKGQKVGSFNQLEREDVRSQKK